MRKNIYHLVGIAMLGTITLLGTRPVEAQSVTPAGPAAALVVKTVVLKVEGMTCGGCALSTRRALQKLPGVTKAVVNLDSALATLTYDSSKVTVEQMFAAVKELGFVPSLAPSRGGSPNGGNASLAIPTGFQRLSFQVNGLYEGQRLAQAREALLKLPGVRDAGTHRRSDESKAGIVWAVYDAAKVTPEHLKAAIRALGYVVAQGSPGCMTCDQSATQSGSGQLTAATFNIIGMTGDGCATAIREALAELPGVRRADASFEKKSATVTYDANRVTVAEIVAALKELNYTATLARTP